MYKTISLNSIRRNWELSVAVQISFDPMEKVDKNEGQSQCPFYSNANCFDSLF
jgi:hypothetical protein